MYDMLPFPRITEKTAEGQVSELVSYITQLKESLEFILSNISVDNLSPELVERLQSLGTDIEKSNENRDEAVTQIAARSISISDVINSDLFEDAVKDISADVKFSVNFTTGYLEYS